MLRIALLGPLEVSRGGTPVRVPAGKVSELLARLAVEGGSVVTAERLMDELWSADAPATRRNTVQAKVKMLRRALGDPALVLTRDGGYALDSRAIEVDALSVQQDAAAAVQRLDAGDDRVAAELAGAALAAYRGEPLASVSDADWATSYRARLDAVHAGLLHTYGSARLRLGEGPELVAELEDAVAAHPFHEDLWALLVTALYRAGRQADALAAYRRVKQRLADELGLDPGPSLRQLEQQVLVQAPSLGPSGRPAGEPAALPPGNLPAYFVPLVGRDSTVSDLVDLLGTERLVEVTGPGGVGKTALALAVGRRLGRPGSQVHDGVWLVRLEGATTPSQVVDAVISALNVPGGEAALLERVRGGRPVLILDNCEHVADAVSALALRLLDAAPGLRILATSQVPLGIHGEVLVELAPLDLAASVELFVQRTARQRAGVSVADQGAESPAAPQQQDDQDSLRALCRSLDGLPLAIELAAARTRTLSVQEITRRLEQPLAVLTDPSSREPDRRRSLRSTIQWSYDLLFPDDQRGLWALATFAGGGGLPAVEHVLGALDVPPAAAIDVVGRLVGRSLVTADQEPGTTRYRLLDSIRAFALEALAGAGRSDRAQEAHAQWLAAAAAESTTGVRSSEQAHSLAVARAERADIDAALAWCAAHSPLLGVRVAIGFGWAWVVLGDSRGAERIRLALAAAGDTVAPQDRAEGLLLAAWLAASTGDLGPARADIAAAEALAEELADDELRARAAYYLAYVVSHQGEWAEALRLTALSRRLYDGLDRPWDQAANGLFEARAALSAGDPVLGRQALDRVQGWLREADDPWLAVRCEAALGELARVERRFDDAVRHLGRAAATSAERGFVQTEAYQVSSLGRALCQAGDYDAGSAALRRAVAKAEAAGDARLAALGRVHLGRVLRALGQDAAARAALEAAADWHRRAGGGEQALLGDCLLAALDAAAGRAGAADRLVTLLESARARSDAPVEVFALDALARVARESGALDRAQQLATEADRRMGQASHFITERDRADRPAGSTAGSPAGRP